jgi:ATP-dependent HslUV protease ATP-binding subunit HslU
MVFYMPGPVEEAAIDSDAMTPRQIVEELDRNIVGQNAAKRAVAIALRSRIRRKKLDPAMAAEVMPKNILMIGTTGVGKTEIARRLARLAGSPFLKVEASKFTEVGYVGRDVESMVRDLLEIAIDMLRVEKAAQVQGPARVAAEARILDHLLPTRPRVGRSSDPEARAREAEEQASWERSRKTLKKSLEAGELEERMIEIQVQTQSNAGLKIFTPNGMEEMDMNLKEMMPGLFPEKKRPKKVSVAEAREILQRDEVDRLIDQDRITREAIDRVESSGILFIDELDKVAGREGGHGPDISREGVQRDLLPIVEGTLVNTKYGMV